MYANTSSELEEVPVASATLTRSQMTSSESNPRAQDSDEHTRVGGFNMDSCESPGLSPQGLFLPDIIAQRQIQMEEDVIGLEWYFLILLSWRIH